MTELNYEEKNEKHCQTNFFRERKKKSFLFRHQPKKMVKAMRSSIKNPHIREEAISIIKALDLKKIRNTSET